MISGTEFAESLFQKIVGMKPTRVKLGHGSFITMDFGRDISEQVKTRQGIVTKQFGEWYLWIYMCSWRVDKNQNPLVGCESSREDIEKALSELSTKTFEKIEILNNAFDARLFFSEQIELHLFSFYTQEAKQWMLYTPDNKVFIAGPGNQWSYHAADS